MMAEMSDMSPSPFRARSVFSFWKREPRGSRMLRASMAIALCALVLASIPAQARDRGADGRFDRRRSSHFLLLQDADIDQRTGVNGTKRFERDILEVLESAHDLLAESLGLRPRSDVEVRVYAANVFDAQFSRAFGFRAAGFFDGTIHVRGGTRVDPQLVRTLHHEYVHAVIHAEAGPGAFPAWLNEGLAEYFETLAIGKGGLSYGERNVLARAVRTDVWIPLGAMSGVSFTHLREGTAALAYLEAYAVVDHLVRRGGLAAMKRFCERFIRTRNLNRALTQTYRVNLVELEAAVLAELR